jgi:hypothetical protein
MTRHVSAEKLARFRDGDLGRAAARRVAAHQASCARCQADADALAALPALLAGTRLPPMPDHLAARIETALATESAHRAAGSPARHAAQHGSGRRAGVPRWVVTDERAQRGAWRSGPARRILATAAAIAVIGGGGYGLVSLLESGPDTASTASGASQSRSAAGPAAAPEARPSAGTPSSGLNAPAVSRGPGTFRAGGASAPAFGPAEQYSHDGHAGRFTPVRTSTDYRAASLGPQAAAALAQVRGAPAGSAGASGSHSSAGQGTAGDGGGAGGAFSTATLAQLPGCVSRVAGGQSVLLVDLARFQGTAAIIIVTAPPGSTTGTQVWAVATGCSSSSAAVLAHDPLP